jgi:hypothetical protein
MIGLRRSALAISLAMLSLSVHGCMVWRSSDGELARFDRKSLKSNFRAEKPFSVAAALLVPSINSAVVKTGPQAYLSLDLSFPAAADLRAAIDDRFGTDLKHRGEAHLTVVTPPELQKILASGLTLDEIKGIAQQLGLQKAGIEQFCLGMGRAKLSNEELRTFYVVVESSLVRRFREAVAKVMISRGTDPLVFDPARYFPHVTIGFTNRDLHESDGVIKDQSTCIAPLQVTVP